MKVYSTILNTFIDIDQSSIDYIERDDIDFANDDHNKNDLNPLHDLSLFPEVVNCMRDYWIVCARTLNEEKLTPIHICELEDEAFGLTDYLKAFINNYQFEPDHTSVEKETKEVSNNIIKSYLPEF